MDGKTSLEAAVEGAPHLPGVYRFVDASGRILYIGKAIDISRRLRGHLSNPGDERHRIILEKSCSVEWTVTRSELEALVLEADLIRIHKPPLNVRLRQDQRYPYLELTMDEELPRLLVTRKIDPSRDIPRFGPYPDARTLRALVEFLQEAFPLRRCRTPRPSGAPGRSCLLGQISRCPAPCVNGTAGYSENVSSVLRVLKGDWEGARRGISDLMEECAASMRYEEAARWRNLLARLDSLGWPAPEAVRDRVSRDIAAVRENWGIILQMRSGRFTGVVRLPFESRWKLAAVPERLSVLIRTYYAETGDIPREVVAMEPPSDAGVLEEWLKGRRGSAVSLISPVRGAMRELVEVALKDLEHFLARLEWKRPGGRRERTEAALEGLADMLGLPAPPRWMVALDASTIQGSFPVAALVSFRDGRPDKAGYRRFSMDAEIGRNDPAMIADAVRRYLAGAGEGEIPSLFLIDGGITQLRAAIGAAGDVALRTLFVAIAEKEETLLCGNEERKISRPVDEPPMRLLIAMRDEAHRFVLHYHRTSRSRGEMRSVLDDIPGIGPALRGLLLSTFGSVDRLRAATEEDLGKIPGIGKTRAALLRRYLDEWERPEQVRLGAEGDAQGREGLGDQPVRSSR